MDEKHTTQYNDDRTQAVGAADKVFELIKREPKGATPPPSPPSEGAGRRVPVGATVSAVSVSPVKPEVCRGEVELRGVDFEYPSRQDHVLFCFVVVVRVLCVCVSVSCVYVFCHFRLVFFCFF